MASKFALVIANTEYQDASFAKLTAPGKDAEEFAHILRELAAFDDVQVLINESEGKTRRSIARFFAERKRDHLLLLYFSGHGIRNDRGQLFLAAYDTEINILEATGIPAEFITRAMNNSRSQRQLLILDCCNSGAFAHGTKSASAVGKSMGIATAFEGSGFGHVVLTATDATQYAWEGDKVIGNTNKSVFTHFLIEGLKGQADLNQDGRIDVDELYDFTYDQVVSRTPKQTPGKWSYEQKGELILRDNLPILYEGQIKSRSVLEQRKLVSKLDLRLIGGVALIILSGLAILTSLFIRGFPGAASAKATQEVATIQAGLIQTAASINFFRLSDTPPAPIATDAAVLIQTLSNTTTLMPTWTPTLTSSPIPSIGSIRISDKDSMILHYVPAGEFMMGSDSGDPDEKPVHTVNLDAFWIDKTEVTNAMYAKCDQIDICNPPSSTHSETRDNYYGNSEFDNYPVINVSWNDAEAYCSWADRRLPTEAEWEKAASWDDKNQRKYVYPWGNDFNGARLNFCDKNCSFYWGDKLSDDGYADTAPVVNYPNGDSPAGALDMAGNVVEWVADWYDVYLGGDPNASSDFGQIYRVVRGGSWYDSNDHVRSADRVWEDPTVNNNVRLGFRCAISAIP